MVAKRSPRKSASVEAHALDQRAHRPVENEDALGEELAQEGFARGGHGSEHGTLASGGRQGDQDGRDSGRCFRERFGLDARALDAAFSQPRSSGRVDYADLFFEFTDSDSVALEEGIVKNGEPPRRAGRRRARAGGRAPGLRALRRGHASRASARGAHGARDRRAGRAQSRAVAVRARRGPRPTSTRSRCAPIDVPVDEQGRAARARSTPTRAAAIRASTHVMASVRRRSTGSVLVARQRRHAGRRRAAAGAPQRAADRRASGGAARRHAGRGRPLRARARCSTPALAAAVARPRGIALAEPRRRCRPAGTMDVVLGPGWPGILLHEAIGHGLEGDFNRKKTSAFSGPHRRARRRAERARWSTTARSRAAAARSTSTTRARRPGARC